MPNEFQFVANDLALDFVNTQMLGRHGVVELIESPEQMLRWLEAAGLTSKRELWNDGDVASALALREAIRSLMLALIETRDPEQESLAQLNRHLLDFDPNLRLVYQASLYRLEQRSLELTPPMALGMIAERAAALLASEERARLRACSSTSCILLFKDTSKSGKRRWCSMRTCGNRAKASAFRANAEG